MREHSIYKSLEYLPHFLPFKPWHEHKHELKWIHGCFWCPCVAGQGSRWLGRTCGQKEGLKGSFRKRGRRVVTLVAVWSTQDHGYRSLTHTRTHHRVLGDRKRSARNYTQPKLTRISPSHTSGHIQGLSNAAALECVKQKISCSEFQSSDMKCLYPW